MRDTDLYSKILGIESPWRVTGVDLRLSGGEVEVQVEYGGEIRCPVCSQSTSRYDTRVRKWRHLDTCQY
jgi:transposase